MIRKSNFNKKMMSKIEIRKSLDYLIEVSKSNRELKLEASFVDSFDELIEFESRRTIDNFDYWMNSLRVNNKWVGISGSWRTINKEIVNDTSYIVRYLMNKGVGILTGGALGVDFIAAEIILKEGDPKRQLRIVLPIDRHTYLDYYDRMALGKYISHSQAESLLSQLKYVNNEFKEIIFDDSHFYEEEFLKIENEEYRKKSYRFRNFLVGYGCDCLVALCVNESNGVLNMVNKMNSIGKDFMLTFYEINQNSTEVIRDYGKLKIPRLLKDYPLEYTLKDHLSN